MKQEHEIVLDLIREVGVVRLGNMDGCICCRFSVRNVDVEIACGKSVDRGVWVSSNSLDYYDADAKSLDETLLRPIADEVVHQLKDCDARGPISATIGPWKKKSEQ